ncbi:MAG: hypothetical protein MUO82_09505 [Candidatus Thermoplasmatota archaeon]|nr:hypothetical protein [Candidatus Thermoplasmatota archaeon]
MIKCEYCGKKISFLEHKLKWIGGGKALHNACTTSYYAILNSITEFEKKQNAMQQQQNITSNRNCPKCGREILFDASICPYCVHNF